MAMMLSSLYDALEPAGAADGPARKAAAHYGNRFEKVEAESGILKWMVGFNLAIGAAIPANPLT